MNKCDLVSIIIPCYNQAHYLQETVQSAINQTYQNIEIIIINDGSTDNTKEVALLLQNKYPEKIHFISQANTGVSKARNNAIEISKGNYILTLDADDIIENTMIEDSLKCLIKENVDIVYVAIKYFGIKNFIDMKKPFSENNILYQNPCSASSVYKKEVWVSVGGYAENMKEGYEDWEFWIHAYKLGFTFHLLPKTLLHYRTQEISRNTNAEEKDIYLKAKIILNHPELYTIQQILQAKQQIKQTEALPNVYFYTSKDIADYEMIISTTIHEYLDDNQISKKQFITLQSTAKKVLLLSLDDIQNESDLNKLTDSKEADFILFYSSLRYDVASLQVLTFSWSKEKGMIDTYGSIFPFVSKIKYEEPSIQLLAYKQLVKYQNCRLEIQKKEIERQVQIRKQKNKLIEEKDKGNKDKLKLLEENRLKYYALIKSIEKLSNCSFRQHPIKKYQAYKTMIEVYANLNKKDDNS